MSFISPIPTDTNGQPKTTGSLQSLGKDDFLQLLVTKLENQDPMNPASDEQFIADLAQFSSLEQMNNIADGISKSNQWDYLSMQSLNNVMASGLIGKEVKSEYKGVYVGQTDPATINFTLDSPAQEVDFTVRDSNGTVVANLTDKSPSVGVNSFKWDGKDDQGNRVAEGYYTIEATAKTAAGTTITPSLSVVGIVQSVIYRDGSAYLKVNGTEIALGDITSVGEPGSNDDGN